MDEQTAKELAREVIRPSGLLGYLVGRGDWWPSESSLNLGRRAVGRVMAATYGFLAPVWHLFPALDPGRVDDSLGLAGQSTLLRDTPEDLGALLLDLEQAVERAVPVLAEHLPTSREHVYQAATEVVASIREAQAVLRGAPPS